MNETYKRNTTSIDMLQTGHLFTQVAAMVAIYQQFKSQKLCLSSS